MIYGYARPTADDSDCLIQIAALRNCFCEIVFKEADNRSASGQFPELERLLALIAPGDVLVVMNLEIVAVASGSLFLLATRLKTLGAGIRSIVNFWCDSTSFNDVWDALAAFSGSDQNTEEPNADAIATGNYSTFGQAGPVASSAAAQVQRAINLVRVGRSVRDAAKDVGVHRATLYRALKRQS